MYIPCSGIIKQLTQHPLEYFISKVGCIITITQGKPYSTSLNINLKALPQLIKIRSYLADFSKTAALNR